MPVVDVSSSHSQLYLLRLAHNDKVHTHMYPPAYMQLMRSRDKIPYVRSFPDDPAAGDRLVILPAEDTASTTRGRPIGPEYYDVKEKLAFMSKHGIDVSVISLANPCKLPETPPAGWVGQC